MRRVLFVAVLLTLLLFAFAGTALADGPYGQWGGYSMSYGYGSYGNSYGYGGYSHYQPYHQSYCCCCVYYNPCYTRQKTYAYSRPYSGYGYMQGGYGYMQTGYGGYGGYGW